jgi:hypothetical protein
MRKIKEGTYSALGHNATADKREGLEKKYLSVREKQEPTYKRDLDKPEAHVIPSGPSLSVKPKKDKLLEKNPYDSLINGRLEASV